MKNILLLFLLLCTTSYTLAKDLQPSTRVQTPILWKLETQPAVWLFGTIHLPDPRVNQLPLAAKLIFNKSDVVLTEIPMEFADTTLAQLKMQRHDGKKLIDVLPKKLYTRLDNYLKSLNILGGTKVMQSFKTWAVYASLSLLPIQIKHPLTKPLDFNIYQSAKQQGKQVGGLETTAEQLAYFDQFSEEEQTTMLNEMLTILENEKITGKNSVEMMTQWYLAGAKTDIRQLMKDIAPEGSSSELEEKVFNILLLQRNKLMAERLVQKIKENPTKQIFVAVGAGHLSSEKNIPYFLDKLGISSKRFATQ